MRVHHLVMVRVAADVGDVIDAVGPVLRRHRSERRHGCVPTATATVGQVGDR